MPDKIEVAKAYVQIVPSADGIRAALTDVFDEETDGLGAKVGQSIGAQLVGTIKKVLAAAGIGKIIKDSIDMGGALQQSIGGIETLFGAGGKSMEDAVKDVDDTKTVSSTSYGDNDESYTLDEAIRNAADKLKDGEVADEVITTDAGYYVIQMKATYDPDATASKKERIINERKSSKFSEVYDAWESAADYTQDDALLKEITFNDIYQMATEAQSETGTESTESTEDAGSTEATEAASETESAAATE